MSQAVITFAHISDTHVGGDPSYRMDGRDTYEISERLVEALNKFPGRLDFVLHTGDVTTERDPASAKRAGHVFSKLRHRLHVVAGNHDSALLLTEHLPFAAHRRRSSNIDELAYSVEEKGLRLVVLDARVSDADAAHGFLPPQQLEFLDRELQEAAAPVLVAVHFPPVPLRCPWVDAEMLMQNGGELHSLLRARRDRVRAVFLGHVHRALHCNVEGVSYFAAPSSSVQFEILPHNVDPAGSPLEQPGYSIVRLSPNELFVTQHFLA